MLASRCGSCHAGAEAAGGYDVGSYLGALGRRADGTATIVAGDATSRLLQTLAPASATPPHRGFDDVLPQLRRWVVDCRASYLESSIHAGGILNPDDPGFHGKLVQSLGWDLATCAKCHGADFGGGTAKTACTTCHIEGPTACGTCHRLPPATGAHPIHAAGGPLRKKLDCAACHVQPADWKDPSHVFLADGKTPDPAPAEVTFGTVASGPLLPGRKGPPTWTREVARCDNVHCHGDDLGDGAAKLTRPIWTAPGTGQADCGTCHGVPPAGHASDRCSLCHGAVIDADRKIVDPDRHIDGVVQLGNASGKCSACHDDGKGDGPFRALGGVISPAALGAGAHEAHVRGSRLRGPIPCGDCHVTPATNDAAGHIDTDLPAEVFPAVAGFASLASADGARPSWDRAARTCADVYCHGGGAKAATDLSPDLHRTPVWTNAGVGEATCGTCHGVPPRDAAHPGTMKPTDCITCHPSTVNAFGNIVRTGPPGALRSTHIDGVVDAK